MTLLRRILSLLGASRAGRTGAPAGRRGVGRRRGSQPKPTGIAAIRALLRR